jgi:CBS domain-containing protein
LVAARELMLAKGLGQLPVFKNGRQLLGLLTERDIVVAEAGAEHSSGRIDGLHVADALSDDARERVALIAADAGRDDVLAALRRSGVQALIVTHDGRPGRVLGIITAADLLYRM